ncbi:unnamed protein product [Protopolystoma xenopodis]|uniref:PH domain-containing protein n=1 Tax=Protopolystoma xenopodis TaxID=117903 RepID=A0A3S5C415_9PLAT|nr:unnamed protein product [Protopolystoma xenopodis]
MNTFVLQAPDSATRSCWERRINELLVTQLRRLREEALMMSRASLVSNKGFQHPEPGDSDSCSITVVDSSLSGSVLGFQRKPATGRAAPDLLSQPRPAFVPSISVSGSLPPIPPSSSSFSTTVVPIPPAMSKPSLSVGAKHATSTGRRKSHIREGRMPRWRSAITGSNISNSQDSASTTETERESCVVDNKENNSYPVSSGHTGALELL